MNKIYFIRFKWGQWYIIEKDEYGNEQTLAQHSNFEDALKQCEWQGFVIPLVKVPT